MMVSIAAPAELFTIAEAAQRLRIATGTLRGWCLTGRVPYLRIGRQIMLSSNDLDAFLRSSRVPAKAC